MKFDDFNFTKIMYKNMLIDIIVVNRHDCYLYFNWKKDAWTECIQIDPETGSIAGNKVVKIKPIYATTRDGLKKIVALDIK